MDCNGSIKAVRSNGRPPCQCRNVEQFPPVGTGKAGNREGRTVDARIFKVAGVILGMGVVLALIKDAAPNWVHFAVLVGGAWLMTRLWNAGGKNRGDPRED